MSGILPALSSFWTTYPSLQSLWDSFVIPPVSGQAEHQVRVILTPRVIPRLLFGPSVFWPRGVPAGKDTWKLLSQPVLFTKEKTMACRGKHMALLKVLHVDQASWLGIEGRESWRGSTALSLSCLGAEEPGCFSWFHRQLSRRQAFRGFGCKWEPSNFANSWAQVALWSALITCWGESWAFS